ncbi:WD domain G-beta repeat domain containing protein [Plasmodium cynomolgi strain B]|uniref:WD domain G-beta repeat domain containing protein n=1 Tax=Plasmodium cynomolgi (strain B) TaxID=1120755 RepID=K6UKG5_PLACD|nr:WD domain G-beta repeat domain containing protein [Plasmodium cynomolgi strain B]GAB66803.1 WD domain G-beta repeat domain containing protein [Plasmodium cynomolgi strain B]
MISTFVKLNEYTILFGTADGVIKVAHILPNKMGDVIARLEGGDSVEKLATNKKKLIASISHNSSIHFYPIHMDSSHISGKIKKKKSPSSAISSVKMDGQIIKKKSKMLIDG